MTKTPEKNNHQNLNQELSSSEKELEKLRELMVVMSKILNISKKEVINSAQLFSNITPNIYICLYKLHKIKEKDQVSAAMLLEYLLFFEEEAMDIINE
jgi:translation initiation factor 2B subunit (eIF-2B alpha/beta/delta family)